MYMDIKYYYKDEPIIEITNGRGNGAKLQSGKIIPKKFLKKPNFEIVCNECGKRVSLDFYWKLLDKDYICRSCNTKGANNPFYGKTHDVKFKKRLSDERKGSWGVGENNAFYGKKHSVETRKKISDNHADVSGKNNPFYGKTHTPETINHIQTKLNDWRENQTEESKRIISQKISDASKEFAKNNPIQWKQNKIKGGRASSLSWKKYKRNKIEIAVEEELNYRGLFPRYSVILGHKQYDFGFKDERILLEVHGDYYHGNPKYYNHDGSNGKKILNEMQLNKQKRDVEKKKFADDNNFKLYYIWEDDIKNKEFNIIDEIENEIQIYRTGNK